jgi:3-methyladenine DNA glycosylase AlkD
MVECICINDKNRPKEIPVNKWLKKDQLYTVIYTVTVLPQKQLAFHLEEIELDETCAPYEYFLANRFGFTQENLEKLIELIKDCNDVDFSMEELLKQTELEEAV